MGPSGGPPEGDMGRRPGSNGGPKGGRARACPLPSSFPSVYLPWMSPVSWPSTRRVSARWREGRRARGKKRKAREARDVGVGV